ncbi:MAG: hypothetical protein QOH41_2083 [Blastocatellia bacterium]|jgi:hypothetical protein|nr:hypothetical protein [Blastocatellia bacterium]
MSGLLFERAHVLAFVLIASLLMLSPQGRIKEGEKVRYKILTRSLMVGVLLILAVPVATSAQVYSRDRYNDRYNNRDQYDRMNRRDVREVISRLDNTTAQLENDVNSTPGRRVMGIFQLRTVDNNAIAQVRDFRRAVRQLRNNSANGRALNGSVDEAQVVLERGVQLDRYLRLRTGSERVDADLSELRSNLHMLADAYGLRVPY